MGKTRIPVRKPMSTWRSRRRASPAREKPVASPLPCLLGRTAPDGGGHGHGHGTGGAGSSGGGGEG